MSNLNRELCEITSDLAVDVIAEALLRATSNPGEAAAMDLQLRREHLGLATISSSIAPAAEALGLPEDDARLLSTGSAIGFVALVDAAKRLASGTPTQPTHPEAENLNGEISLARALQHTDEQKVIEMVSGLLLMRESGKDEEFMKKELRSADEIPLVRGISSAAEDIRAQLRSSGLPENYVDGALAGIDFVKILISNYAASETPDFIPADLG